MATAPRKARTGNLDNPGAATAPPVLLSARGYASHRGVSHQAVTKALREGRIKQSASKIGKGWQIDPVAADLEWDRTTDGSKQRRRAATARKDSPATQAVAPPTDEQLAAGAEPPPIVFERPEDLPRTDDFQGWRTRREEMQARLLWIDVAERQGLVMDVTAAERIAFEAARQLRNGLLALPAQLSGEFAGCQDPIEIANKLEAAFHRLFERFSQDLAAMRGRAEVKRAV